MKLVITLFLISFTVAVSAQEKINQYDANGKKHGKWVVYWDVNWKNTDSATAVYARYNFFHHGSNLQPMGPCGAKGSKLEEKTRSNEMIGNARLLDGEFKWYDDKGRLRFIFEITKGEFVKYTEYRSSGKLDQVFDYTKHINEDQPHSWYIIGYDKKGNKKNDGYGGVIFRNNKAGKGRD
ncbi:MAG TPA: hypothetical protein VK177_11235 [Flavobacteriales bacterium]|nr:hypothetical protein [Flavobacteriales bacterium]